MYARLVKEFTGGHTDIDVPPTLLSPERVAFIRRMVQDELDELDEAVEIVDQADAAIDIIYYLVDTFLRVGVDLDELFATVHASNMAKKFPDGTFHKVGGKVIKPEGWHKKHAPEPKMIAAIERMRSLCELRQKNESRETA